MSHLITFLSVGVNVLLPCNATQSVVLLQHVCLSVCHSVCDVEVS